MSESIVILIFSFNVEGEIIFTNKDKMPEKKDFTNLLEISETKVDKILQKLEK